MITKFELYPEERRTAMENYVAEYTFEQTDPTPWTPLRRRLHESSVSVLTTAGLRLKTQAQYVRA